MDTARQVTRRAAIKDMGKAGLAVMVFGTGCTGEPGSGSTTTSPGGTSTSPLGSSATTTTSESTTTPPQTPTTEWARVQMAIVSAYILYRGGEAALVDTGQAGSAPSIQAALTDVGLNWGAIGHVILTHRHPDHIGSADAVAALAPDSIFYIGDSDLSHAVNQVRKRTGKKVVAAFPPKRASYDLKIAADAAFEINRTYIGNCQMEDPVDLSEGLHRTARHLVAPARRLSADRELLRCLNR